MKLPVEIINETAKNLSQRAEFIDNPEKLEILRKKIEGGRVCAQVITPAISPEGICKEFPTPCDVPQGWKNVEKCPESARIIPGTITPSSATPVAGECKTGEIKYYQCSDGTSGAQCKCAPEGKWICVDSPETICKNTQTPITIKEIEQPLPTSPTPGSDTNTSAPTQSGQQTTDIRN